MELFGHKLTLSELRTLRGLSDEVTCNLQDLALRANSRQRSIAKYLLRELALEHGIDASLALIDITVESCIRNRGLNFR